MVDSADIYFIQHFADIYFSKFVCISVCGGVSSKSYLLPSFILISFLCLAWISENTLGKKNSWPSLYLN